MAVRRGKERRSDTFPTEPDLGMFIEFFKKNGFVKVMPPFPDTVYWPSKVIRLARKNGYKVYSLAQYYDKVPQSHHLMFSDGELCYEVYTDIGVVPKRWNFSIYDENGESLIDFEYYDNFRPYAIECLKENGAL